MSPARKLLSPRWLAGHLLALSLILLFVNFGFWQLRRMEERNAYNALLEARLGAEPEPLAALLARYSATAAADAERSISYRRAQVTGRFDAANEVLLRSRANDGSPGYHVLTPLRLSEGRAILVDRGWVPYALDTPPVAEAAPPDAPVELTGVLYPPQTPVTSELLGRFGLLQQDPAEGELEAVFFVNPARLERQLPYALEPVYLELASQTPPQRGQLPVPPPPPEITAGPHLSYALQWFAFALIGGVGYLALLRGVLRERQATEDVRPEGG
jgi:surfeit locus 1 family protein